MAGTQALGETVRTLLERSYTLKKEDLGADARLSKSSMVFDTEAWEIPGLGHLCIMRMKAFFGLMKMETAVLSVTGRDLPLLNLDWVKAFGKETQIAELYDTQLTPYPAEKLAEFDALRARRRSPRAGIQAALVRRDPLPLLLSQGRQGPVGAPVRRGAGLFRGLSAAARRGARLRRRSQGGEG